MKKTKKYLIIFFIILSLISITKVIYAKYILTRQFNVAVTSAPFYFNISAVSDSVTFPRTADTSDKDTILTQQTTFNLLIKNNDGTNFNVFDTTYNITILDTSKFIFAEGDTVTKTLKGNSKIDDNITLNLQIKDLSNPQKQLKLRITSTSPYVKTFDITLDVVQKGAIQTVEDLVNLSLAVRDTPFVQLESTKEETTTQRYKLTRNLDFNSPSSYENAYRTDYGDTNLDKKEETLIDECSNHAEGHAGFLPIGINDLDRVHEFKGTFNGGNHTISNLYIHKALQEDIGLFGFTYKATIKNLTIENGDIRNTNQTAGMIVGKAQGGIIQNITVNGTSVLSLDDNAPEGDSYAGGIVGFVELGAQILSCTNYARVESRFSGDTGQFSGAAGGITGWMATSTIDSCENHGTVIGQKYIGGIAGFASMQDSSNGSGGGTVKNCHNYGNVTTNVTNSTSTSGPGCYVGGICGYNKAAGIVDTCKNHEEATVYGVASVGGIVGGNYGTVKNCNNLAAKANITSKTGTNTHGVCGMNDSKATKSNCTGDF